jgi:hypothetical protein
MNHIINNYFENVFVIAHPESQRFQAFNERWEGLNYRLCQFVMQGLNCVSKDGLAVHNLPSIPNDIPLLDPLSDGQVACALAHMLIYQIIANENLSNCLILEDDSVFNTLSNLEIALNSDYDILALFTADCDLYTTPHLASPYTDKYTRAGTSAYVIRTSNIACDLYESQVKKMNTADGVIMRSDKKIYAVYPPVCSCDDSPSIIVNGFY